ncbi:MAG: S8 family serine peptidase [Actinomycetota bacterium]
MLGVLLLTALILAPADLAGARDEAGVSRSSESSALTSEWGSYIVVMKADPLVATVGADGLSTARAQAVQNRLLASHDRVLEALGADVEKINEYTVALNGFSALLSPEEAEELAAKKNVLLVLPDELQQAQTDSSPAFLGLTGGGGAHASGVRGEGVVVGVIDTGIWPEHPSFADTGYPAPPTGGLPCEFGNTAHNPNDAPFTCNNKLIGAVQSLDTYRELIGAEPDEFDSARDDDGHGTHTASTAAGNAGVDASILGRDVGTISGIAPRAHVIAYKGLGNLGGFTSDLVDAIDQAVEDGVDVINYSIGGGASLTGGDDIAFLFAADAGVFVATSAGNSGPGEATIGGPASVPWLTSVGANTQSRFFQGRVILGNGLEFTGASITHGVGPATLVDAASATQDGSDICEPGTLRRGQVRGSIVLCRRGEIARVAKSEAVLEAGGVGMIMYENGDTGNLFTDTHWVPSVHVDNTPGLAIKAYIATGTNRVRATAEIVTGEVSAWANAPTMTDFSSRGPDPVAEDIIKPDVTAPGIQILAGNSPFPDAGSVTGELFMAIAGTSMSSPHVAGLFALISQEHPDWTPAMAKSALMTTADTDVLDNDRATQATPFEMGAGHVDPGGPGTNGSAFRPGLVYDAGFLEYLGFLCDADPSVFANPTGTCTNLANNGVPTRAVDLNYPSIGVSQLAGTETVTRTVTSVAPDNRRYTVSIEAPDGYDVTVTPSSFSIPRGRSRTFEVTIDNVSAPTGEWRFGSLTWNDSKGAYAVRSPIAVRGSLLSAPAEITGSGVDGSASFDVKFGYTGPYSAGAHGLVPATLTVDNVSQDPDQNFDPTDGFSNAHEFDLSDVAHFRIAIPPEATEPEADLDVYVFDPAGDLVAQSTLGGTDEVVDISAPADGTWTVYVHGWSTPGGDSDYTMYTWAIPEAAGGGNLTIDSAPTSATIGETGTVSVSWTGATAGQWHLSAVSHNRGDEVLGLTLIEVDNR